MADYGVTSTGFKAKRYEEIFADIKTRFKTDLGIDLDRNPDMVSKVITNIITLPIAQSWSNTQTLQSMFDVDKAEGVWLDNLASFYGITRSIGSYARGRLSITASDSVTIVAGESFSDQDGNRFTNDQTITLSSNAATSITFSTPTANVSLNVPEVTINGKTFSETATSNSNESLILIADAINVDGDLDVTADVFNEGADSLLTITSINPFENFSFSSNNTFTTKSFTGYGDIRSEDLGDTNYREGTVVVFPSYTDILEVSNEEPIDDGAGEETDSELRSRIKTTRNTGKATLSALKSELLSLTGVNKVIVLENDEDYQDTVNGIKPHSFKCIVKGGSPDDIVQSIWDTKPAGVPSSGDQTGLATDSEGDKQTVYYSRVTGKYIHVNVRYSLYSEESAPKDVSSAIKSAVLSYGDTLDVGVDVIQGRIAANIYQNVSGLERVIVRVGSTEATDDPIPVLNETPPISILPFEEAEFSEDRIVVTTI